MIRKMAVLTNALAICIAVVALHSASAQPSTRSTLQDSTSQHHQWTYRMMKEMTDQMSQMTKQMSEPLTPAQRLEMGQRMSRMSVMMRRLSGLAARPVMREREWQKRTGQMRKEMDEMTRGMRMNPDK
jgi:hypothetical protein